MAAGPLLAASAQSTTTTTGTGPITIVNTVPAGAPAGSTTFAAAFAPTAVFPVPNIFYTIIDASGNIEAGYGTLTSATVLTRDFVIFAGVANTVAPFVPSLIGTPTGSFTNLAAGTANVYSNPSLLSQVTPYQQRFPNFTGNQQSSAQDGGITEDIMQGSFTGTITNGGAGTTGTVNYKVASNGEVQLSFPAALTNASAGTTSVMTGLPSYLANITTQNVIGLVVSNTATVLGLYVIAAGATPTSTGTITLQQSTGVSPIGFTGTFTTAVANGIPATVITYTLH
jgi:hypothetical protein